MNARGLPPLNPPIQVDKNTRRAFEKLAGSGSKIGLCTCCGNEKILYQRNENSRADTCRDCQGESFKSFREMVNEFQK